MDLDFVIGQAAATLPQELGELIPDDFFIFPQQLRQVIGHAASYMPVQVDLMSAAQFILFFTAASLILGTLSRVVLGKRSSLNHSFSAALGILFIYVLTIAIYTFKPWSLEAFLAPLPFVTFSGEYLIIFPIADAAFPAICREVLSLVILAFLVNLIDSIFPKGKTGLEWFLFRFISVPISMALHFAVRWAFVTYLPELLVTYAPAVLLLVLVFMLLSGIISLIIGLVISVANPFLGAMYTFFFSNVIGKQLSKAVFSTAILCAVVYLLEYFGYTVISITTAALAAYIPLVLVLLVLWFVIGHVL